MGWGEGTPKAAIDQLATRMKNPEVAESLAGIGFRSPESIRGLLVGQVSPDDEALADLEILRDRHPSVEYSAPRNALLPTYQTNRAVQIELFERSLSDGIGGPAATVQRRAVLAALRAGLALAEGRFADARSLADEARGSVQDHPIVNEEAFRVYHALGAGARNRGDLANASQLLAKALECRPDEFRPAFSLALVHLRLGNLPVAKTITDHGIKAFPNSPYFPSLRAAIARGEGQLAEACAQHEEAIRRAPELEKGWDDYAETVRLSGDPRAEERYRRFVQGL